MKRVTNPNFQTLGLAAFRVLENLIKQREIDREERNADRSQKRRREKSDEQHSESVGHDLHVTPV
jgi:hypothetical protein